MGKFMIYIKKVKLTFSRFTLNIIQDKNDKEKNKKKKNLYQILCFRSIRCLTHITESGVRIITSISII